MFNKSFNEMRSIDISKRVLKRDNISYLNWADCKSILHENGAETVFFTPIVNANGSSLISTDIEFEDKNGVKNRCYETRILITVDDKSFEIQYPIMNGTNAVKDNSMSQQRLANAQTRAFVKGVAIHLGLGFDLWCKEEKESEKTLYTQADDLSVHNVLKIRERMLEHVTDLLKKDFDNEQIAEICGFEDVQDMQVFYKKSFAKIFNVEQALKRTLHGK